MPLSFFAEIARSPSRRLRVWLIAFLLGIALAEQPLVFAALFATALLVAARVTDARRFLALALLYLVLGALRPQFRPLVIPVPAAALAHARARTVFAVRRAVPGPEAHLLLGMSVGEIGGMPKEMKRRFRATGTTHLLAVSGANLAIAAGTLTALLFFCGFGRRGVAPLAAAGVVAFAAFTGGEPPVVRAACMALLILLAREAGRTPDRANVLLAAAAAMLAVDPRLAGSASFQLSLAATGGLLWLAPPIASALPARLPEFIRTSVADGVAALLTTLPITVGTFGDFSAVALPANVLAAPLVPLLTVGGGLLAVLAQLWPAAALAVGSALGLVAWVFTEALGLLARVPGAFTRGGSFPVWFAVLWYLVLCVTLSPLSNRRKTATLSPTFPLP